MKGSVGKRTSRRAYGVGLRRNKVCRGKFSGKGGGSLREDEVDGDAGDDALSGSFQTPQDAVLVEMPDLGGIYNAADSLLSGSRFYFQKIIIPRAKSRCRLRSNGVVLFDTRKNRYGL